MMSVSAFNSLPNGQYSNLFNVADFSCKSSSVKTSLLGKISYLQTLPEDKAEISSVCNIELCFARFYFYYCFDFLVNSCFYNKFFLNRNGLSDDRVVSFTKNQYDSLVYSL